MNGDIPKSSKCCCRTKRPFKLGEVFVSVLFEENGDYKRLDYSMEAWNEADRPENMIGFWKTKINSGNEKKVRLAPNDILLNLFDELADQPDKIDIRYVLTLLMIRRRIFRLEQQKSDSAEQIVVYAIRRETTYTIPVIPLSEEQKEKIQNYLATLLYSMDSKNSTKDGSDNPNAVVE